jgi:C4-dicarboxylate transporter DctQ subunit
LGRFIDKFEWTMVTVCCGGIVVLIFSGVLSRFIFHYSIAWSEEMARFLFIWGALFGAAAGFRSNSHGGIPLVVDRLSKNAQRIIAVIVFIGVTVFLGLLAWQTLGTTLRAFSTGQASTTTGLPFWIVNALMGIAFALAALRQIQGYFAPQLDADARTLENLKE